uniref:SPT2 homolog N-terminal domain-containing protein n=1 Tax=Photinus pyralis TaxID=7054 RepID=A0A1Y1K910_PHOPY
MDFGSLLQTAKVNDQSKKEVRYYSTKFAPPKKEEKKTTNLSANIQKFLARKEAEERQKQNDAVRKRSELLALRSKDKKATRRVNVMLKRTKSANQSVIEDAVDKDNTAVTLVGPSQPDEDDYGYVSQEASAFYNKMMEKYNKMPDDPKFPSSRKKASINLTSTKDRVRAALEREKEEALMPHRRKRKTKEEEPEIESTERVDEYKIEPPVKKKPKMNAPPALNFNDLLKLAAVKQHEPIMIEVKPKEEEGPLLTKKQKKELEREQQRKDAKNQKILQQSNSKTPTRPLQNIQEKKAPHSLQVNGKVPTRPESQPPEKINKVPHPTKPKQPVPTKSPLPTQRVAAKPPPPSKSDLQKKKFGY